MGTDREIMKWLRLEPFQCVTNWALCALHLVHDSIRV